VRIKRLAVFSWSQGINVGEQRFARPAAALRLRRIYLQLFNIRRHPRTIV
jgi:hypothetical protein